MSLKADAVQLDESLSRFVLSFICALKLILASCFFFFFFFFKIVLLAPLCIDSLFVSLTLVVKALTISVRILNLLYFFQIIEVSMRVC